MPRVNQSVVARRVQDLARLRLEGATVYELAEHVRSAMAVSAPPWSLQDGERPLSQRQVARYVSKADRQIAEAIEHDRPRLIGRHLALRRAIFSRAMKNGELRVALAALKDEAKMLGLYEQDGQREKLTLNVLERLVVSTVPNRPALPAPADEEE